jgi:hypothetical protein
MANGHAKEPAFLRQESGSLYVAYWAGGGRLHVALSRFFMPLRCKAFLSLDDYRECRTMGYPALAKHATTLHRVDLRDPQGKLKQSWGAYTDRLLLRSNKNANYDCGDGTVTNKKEPCFHIPRPPGLSMKWSRLLEGRSCSGGKRGWKFHQTHTMTADTKPTRLLTCTSITPMYDTQ